MYLKRFSLMIILGIFAALFLAACSGGGQPQTVTETIEVEVTRIVEVEVPAEGGAAAAGSGSTLKTVQERGEMICGTPQGTSPGFGFIEADGSYSGFDWDYCRVVAAAVLGDADAVVEIHFFPDEGAYFWSKFFFRFKSHVMLVCMLFIQTNI